MNDCINLVPKIENELKKIVSSYRPKHKNIKMNPYYYRHSSNSFNNIDCYVGVQLFDHNKMLDEDNEIIDAANDIADDIYDLVVKFANSNKYDGFKFKVDIPENYCIDISIS